MSASVARLPSRPARPTIEVGGRANATLEAALLSYALTECLDGMAHGELRFGNWGGADRPGFQYFDRQTLDFAAEIVVKLRDSVLFRGRISALSGHYPSGAAPEIGVLAEDRLQDLRMVRRTRSYEKSSLADVARRIAGDNGLQADVSGSGPTYAALAQVNQSDLAFLNDLARREGVQVWCESDRLVLRKDRERPDLELAWAGTLREFEVTADLAGQRTKVTASGWSVADKKAVLAEAQKSAVQGELGADESGADILAAKFGERPERIVHQVPANEDEARSQAEASYRYMARNFVTGRGVCETDPLVRCGAKVTLSGLGPLFDGAYRLRSVTHLFDAAEGSRSEFTCDRPGLGRP
ncbi:MAG: contractile injection system protein, VgrG/Pvc8 family [Novosphingobium sp.]